MSGFAIAGVVTIRRRSSAGTLLFQIGIGLDCVLDWPQKGAQRTQRTFAGLFITGPHHANVKHSVAWIWKDRRYKKKLLWNGRRIIS